MNTHHKVSYVLATALFGTTAAPIVGPVLAAAVAGTLALIGVFIQGWLRNRKGDVLESHVVALLASEAIRKDEEIERLTAELKQLRSS